VKRHVIGGELKASLKEDNKPECDTAESGNKGISRVSSVGI
jgi:hypothetical protein